MSLRRPSLKTAWLALWLLCFGAVAPSAVQLAGVSGDSYARWVEVCTRSGVGLVRVVEASAADAGETDGSHTPAAGSHCPFCATQVPALAADPPGVVPALVRVVLGGGLRQPADAPRAGLAWDPLQPRAPPARS
jgi:hypothetical protein